MSWIMTMRRTERPITYSFAIGAMVVADITFSGKIVWLRTLTDVTHHNSMSDALKEMHRQLNGPAPEGYETRALQDRR